MSEYQVSPEGQKPLENMKPGEIDAAVDLYLDRKTNVSPEPGLQIKDPSTAANLNFANSDPDFEGDASHPSEATK